MKTPKKKTDSLTNGINLRPWTIADLDNLVKYANNWNIAKYMTDKFPFPYLESDGNAFIDLVTKENPIHSFAITFKSEAIGGIGIYPQSDIHKKNAELGYWLAEPFWGKGIMSKAIRDIVSISFETYDIDRVFARPFGINIPSQRVLENNGFVLEGKLDKVLLKNGVLFDELIYAIRRENWEKQIMSKLD